MAKTRIPNDPIRILEHGSGRYTVLDFRSKYDRMRAIDLSVLSSQCTLHRECRMLVVYIATSLAQDEEPSIAYLAKALGRSIGTTVKRLDQLNQACGDNAIEFIDSVLQRKCAVHEWYRALEKHGGRDV